MGLSSNKGLFDSIIDNFSDIPKASKKVDHDNYGVINVSPSIVPNPYLPTFRIFSYNVTGTQSAADIQLTSPDDYVHTHKDRTPGHHRGRKDGDKKALCKKKEHRDTWKCRLRDPWFSDEAAPSRTNSLWTPLGFAQVRMHRRCRSILVILLITFFKVLYT